MPLQVWNLHSDVADDLAGERADPIFMDWCLMEAESEILADDLDDEKWYDLLYDLMWQHAVDESGEGGIYDAIFRDCWQAWMIYGLFGLEGPYETPIIDPFLLVEAKWLPAMKRPPHPRPCYVSRITLAALLAIDPWQHRHSSCRWAQPSWSAEAACRGRTRLFRGR